MHAIISISHYYPCGLKHQGYNGSAPNPKYQYKYNGKELQPELGLDWYDYGARNYDPAIGRMLQIDPNAYKYNAVSPYNYVVNNPLNFVDPDGKDFRLIINANNDGTYNLIVQTTVHLYGNDASTDIAKEFQEYAKDYFHGIDENGIKLEYEITYKYHESADKAVSAMQDGDNLMQYDVSLDMYEMYSTAQFQGDISNPNDQKLFTERKGIAFKKEANVSKYGEQRAWAANHELNHLFGGEDKYSANLKNMTNPEARAKLEKEIPIYNGYLMGDNSFRGAKGLHPNWPRQIIQTNRNDIDETKDTRTIYYHQQ